MPDIFRVSGKSLIRNLQIGMKVTRDHGRTMKVGCIPDQSGFISQMPQILTSMGQNSSEVTSAQGARETKSPPPLTPLTSLHAFDTTRA